MPVDPDLAWYYGRGGERDRLARPGAGLLEWLRTTDVLERVLPAGGRVLDIGGGPGAYASWLAARGHAVTLYDPVPLHVEQARARGGFAAEVGDARSLPEPNGSADAVLLLGPLYHLPEPGDRAAALGEALRVLRPGGVLVAAAISRYASLIDGTAHDFLSDSAFAAIAEVDLRDGRHVNPERHPGYFTTAFFHRPAQLAEEVTDAGFTDIRLVAVEGFAAAVPGDALAAWLADPGRRDRVLTALRRVESEPDLIGATGHLLALASKPA